MKCAVASFQTDKTAVFSNRTTGAAGIEQHRCAADGDGNIRQLKTGEVKFQHNLIPCFIHIHQGTIFPLIKGIAQLKRMQQGADLTDMATENFLLKRFPTGISWHTTHHPSSKYSSYQFEDVII